MSRPLAEGSRPLPGPGTEPRSPPRLPSASCRGAGDRSAAGAVRPGPVRRSGPLSPLRGFYRSGRAAERLPPTPTLPPPRCSRSAAAGRLGRTLPPAPRPALTVPAAGTIPRAAAAPHRLRSPPPPAARRRRAGAGRGRGPALPRRHRHRLPPPLAVSLPLRLGDRDAGPAALRGAVPGPAGGRAVRGSGGSIPLPPQQPVSNSSGRHLTGGAGTGAAPRPAPGPRPAPDETPPVAGVAPRIGTGIRTSSRAGRETRTAGAGTGTRWDHRADGPPQDGPPDGRLDSALPAARTHGQPWTELSPSPGAAGGGDRAPRVGWPQPHGVGGSPADPPHSQQPRGGPSHSGTPRNGRPVGSGGGKRGPSLRRVPRTRATSGHRVPRVRVRRRSPPACGPLPPPAPCLPPQGPPQARGTWGPAGEPSRARASPYVTAQGPPRPSRGSRVLLANVPNPRAASARPRFARAPRAGAGRWEAARPRPRLLGLSRAGMTAPLPSAASPVEQCEG